MTALQTFRISRRRLGQLLGTSIAASTLMVPAAGVQARQDAALTNLRVANESEPTSLDPWMRGYAQALVTRQIYQGLVAVRMTLDGEEVIVEHVPVLAESWEQVDDLTLRFTIRQGVTFHNGEALDAHAVKASYDVLNNAETAAAMGAYHALAATSGAEVVDDFTIDIMTETPNNELIGITLAIGMIVLPPALLAEQGIEAFAENPVGTGAYKFVSWSKGQEIKLAGFDEYWDAANVTIVPEATIVSRPEAAVRAQSVTAGETDFAYNIGAEQASALASSVIGGGFQSSSIRLNNQIAPTNDVNVRLAINHAIDRQAIVDSIFQGTAQPLAFFGFQPVTLEPYSYDPELAMQLLDEAGATGTEVELVYGEGRIPEEDQLAEIYKAYLDSIGLNVTLTKLEPAQYNELGEGPFEEQPPLYMETTSSGNYGEVAGSLKDKYGSNGTGTFSDAEFDARFDALVALGGEERQTELQSIAEDLHAIAPRAWVAAVQQVHGISDALSPNLALNVFISFTDLMA